jgi:integrase
MRSEQESPKASISVFTRHSADCEHKADPQYKKCRCRKSLYIYEDGKVRYRTAGTRSWERAESIAVEERLLRDPAEILKQKLAALEAEQKAAEAEKQAEEEAATMEATAVADAAAITVEAALDLWLKGQKDQSDSTAKTYRIVRVKISRWAKEQDITLLRSVTPAALDKWRSEWCKEAPRKDDRMGTRTQDQFQMHLKAFFRWAYINERIPRDPSKALKPFKCKDEQTMPLTPEQFDQVLAAIDLYDEDRRREEDRFGTELRALCLVMRWTGLRITDVLMLPRKALVGNRLTLKTQKTKDFTLPVLPDHVVEALLAIQPRPGVVDPAYFFWSRRSTPHTLGKRWAARISILNEHLSLVDEQGQPMRFHSHMLRDTYAVEMLLAGVALEDVSKLLTHASVRTTEKHYAPWVRARKQQLENKAVAAMRRMGASVSL